MNYVERLQEISDTFLCTDRRGIVDVVLNDPAFATAPGGAKHHHNYRGGLVQHTLEVAHLAMQFAEGFGNKNLIQFALIAAIFHDYGKIHEYVFNEDGTIGTTDFKTLVGHPVYSAKFFYDHADDFLDPSEADAIYHAILAHHGRREWGSPVEPATPLAWALHSADMLSSRGYYKPKAEAKETLPALVHLEGWKSDGTLVTR